MSNLDLSLDDQRKLLAHLDATLASQTGWAGRAARALRANLKPATGCPWCHAEGNHAEGNHAEGNHAEESLCGRPGHPTYPHDCAVTELNARLYGDSR